METKTKAFDAVAESRKWREATSRKLDAMTLEQRLAHLASVKRRYMAQQKLSAEESSMKDSCVVREEPPKP